MFKVGDKVRRLNKTRQSIKLGVEVGEIYTVACVKYSWLGLKEVVDESDPVPFDPDNFELVETKYPNPPHIHAELIKEWAQGAEIEARSLFTGEWFFVTNPGWSTACTYRIKPQKTEQELQQELQIEKLELTVKQAETTVKDALAQIKILKGN